MSVENDFKVTLLGTGAPPPDSERFGPSTLVEVGDQKLLFDAGRGVPIRLWQIKVPMGKIDMLFITHYHSDHTVGIPDLWLTGWLNWPWGKRTTPFRVIGPTGAKALMAGLEMAYAGDINVRLSDQPLPRQGIAIITEEFYKDGVVYEKNGVKVIAFEVDHGKSIKPACGYRIEYKGRSAVISGDTTYHQNTIRYGTGADLLIHEVAMVKSELEENPTAKTIMSHHASPRQAGMVFSQAKPKMAAYTHILFLALAGIAPPTIAEIVADTRKTYNGPLEIGEDLTSFEVGDTITVRRYKR